MSALPRLPIFYELCAKAIDADTPNAIKSRHREHTEKEIDKDRMEIMNLRYTFASCSTTFSSSRPSGLS